MGSSWRRGPTSSNSSRSVRPVYLNFVPHEKKLPPLTTGTTEPDGNLKGEAYCLENQVHALVYKTAILHSREKKHLFYCTPPHMATCCTRWALEPNSLFFLKDKGKISGGIIEMQTVN